MELHEAKHRATDRQPVRIVPRPTTTLPQLSSPTILGEPLLADTGSSSLFTCPSLPAQVMPTTFAGVPSLLVARMPTATNTVTARAVPVTPVSQQTVALTIPGAAVQALASPTSIIVVPSEAKSELSSRPMSAVLGEDRPAAAADAPSSDETRRCTTGNCGWPSCKLKHVAHFHCCHCRDAYTDIQGLSEHLTRMHGVPAAAGVQPSSNLEPTNLTNSTSLTRPTTSPASAGGYTTVRQSGSVCLQSASNNTIIPVHKAVNSTLELYDNENENDGELVINMSSPDKDRSSSNGDGEILATKLMNLSHL